MQNPNMPIQIYTKFKEAEHIVIYTHTDADGMMSGILLQDWVRRENPKAATELFKWTYGWNVNLDPIKKNTLILMADCTFPLDVMAKIAERTIWIDHHKTSITNIRKEHWYKNLLFDGSNEEMPKDMDYQVRDMNVHLGKKLISGTGLCWYWTRYNEPMTKPVYYTDRYDIWDLIDPNVMQWHMAYQYRDSEFEEMLVELATASITTKTHETAIERILSEGKIIKRVLDKVAVRDTIKKSTILNISGWPVLFIMADNINGDWFSSWQSVHQKVLPVQFRIENCPKDKSLIAMWVSYKPQDKMWVFSFRDIYERNIGLKFMQYIVDGYLDEVISSGGHPNACGASCKDINRFIKLTDMCVMKLDSQDKYNRFYGD